MTSEMNMLLDDAEARSEALDTERSFIVQAPAGSGKTELLIQRYLKLLAIVADPEEILAITFTRKAAAEMQLRVIQALKAAHAGDVPTRPHQKLTAELARRALQQDARQGWQLTANPRRMRIQTLDSLNASIARSQPLSSPGGAAANAIVVDAALKSMYRQAAAATLDWLAETGDMHDATQSVLRHVDNNTWLYISYLSRMLETRDQWLPFVSAGLVSSIEARNLRTQFEQSLEQIVTTHLEQTHALFPAEYSEWFRVHAVYAAENLIADGKSSDPVCALRDLDDVPGADIESREAWIAIAELLLTKKGDLRKTVNKNQGFPTGDDGQKASYCELLAALAEKRAFRTALHDVRELPPVQYSDEQWEILLALFRLLPLAVGELQRLFNENGLTDHIEVALAAAAALGTADSPGDVALLLDYQLSHLLVDEMQDTSSAQYQMLESLAGGWQEGDGRTLFCVGDPMQSIYRFRNAEVGQFLLARERGIGNIKLHPLVLRRNFRSGSSLVDWYNAVFPSVLPGNDDATRSAVSYSAAVSVPEQQGKGEVHVWPLFGSSTAAEAETGLRVIKDTLEANPDDDMAVLVRSRTQLPGLLSRLRKAGVAYRAVDIDRLTDLPEVIEALALTRAMVHAGDRLAWLAVLRAPWIGLDWTDLHALVRGNSTATILEQLHEPRLLRTLSSAGQDALQRALPVLHTAIACSRTDSLRDRVEKAWLSLGGASIVEDQHAIEHVYRYFDVLDRHETGGSLADVAELESILDLERVSNDASARLQVMTMHRAKGLQFAHVLLFGLGRVPGASERAVLGWFDLPDGDGGGGKIISPVGARSDIENDPIHRYIERTESAKDAFEYGRLLYVACTRAEKSLQITGNVAVAKDGSEFRRPDARSLLSLMWSHVEAVFTAAFDPDQPQQGTSVDPDWLQPVLHRFETPWQLPDVTAPLGATQADGEAGVDQAVEFYWVGSAARLAGTIVHRWLQRAADGSVDIKAGVAKATTTRWLQEMGVADDLLAHIVRRVDDAIAAVADDDRGRWLLSGEGFAELQLSGVVDGDIRSVVLDRVRIDDDGTHWVVDYKTSSHEGGNLQGFLQAEVERYRGQLQRYVALYSDYSGAAVKCALYFPLLQEFVEVPLPN
ncbi:MAG: UvrD-helicase domain-containing protein [Woeseiaceae bacterium]